MDIFSKLNTPDNTLGKMKEKNQNIQVFVRVRPMNWQEKAKHSLIVLDCPGNREVVVKERTMNNLTKTFTFDKVFGPNSKQIDVYKSVVSPLLEEVLLGYNCTVFAYGQTGTGKTFTMEGDRNPDTNLSWDKDPMSGIVPRALNQLFDELRVQNVEFSVRVSLLELYNEELFDLLAQTEDMKLKTLRIYEDTGRKGSVVIQGLEEVTVHNKHEVYSIMEKGSLRRQTASTLMNDKSSRSHTVFTVTVHIKECNLDGEELLKIGKLNLVDLAGSENIGRSGAVDKRAREAGSINQSLLTLGRVITSLVERAPHVPYRESKLTRLLQDSLGGRTKTSIIATVSPASINLEETLSTLDYAHRAKNITNRPEINQKLTKKAMLKAYTEEIEQLKKDLLATREKNGIFVEKGNYEKMMSQLESQGQDISERITQVKSLEENLEKKEEELTNTMATLEEAKEDLSNANQVIEDLKDQLQRTNKDLRLMKQERDEKGHLVEKHRDTENKLSGEAVSLLNTANTTTVNLENLYCKLERKKRVEESNLETGQRFKKGFTEQLQRSITSIGNFRAMHAQMSGNQRLDLESFLQGKLNEFEIIKKDLFQFSDILREKFAFLSGKTEQQCSSAEQYAECVSADMHRYSKIKSIRCDKFFGSLVSAVGDLHSLIVVMEADHLEITNKMMNHNVFMDNTVKSFTDKLVEDMNITTASIEEHVIKHANILMSVDTKVSESKKSEDEYNSIIMKGLTAFQTQINEMLSKSNAFVKEVEGKEAAILAETKLLKTESESFAGLVTGQIHKRQETAIQHTEHVNELSVDFNSNVVLEQYQFTRKVQEGRKVLDQHHKDVVTYVSTESDLCDKLIENAQNDCNSLIEKSSEFRTTLTTAINDVSATSQSKIVELEVDAKVSFDTDAKMVENVKDDIKRECEYASTWAEEEALNYSQQIGMLSEYFDSTYLVDLPTGATPQRKVYEYPLKLSATSPHETILSRFRKARKVSLPPSLGKLDYSDIDYEISPGKLSDEVQSTAEWPATPLSGLGDSEERLSSATTSSGESFEADRKVLNKENAGGLEKTGKSKAVSSVVNDRRERQGAKNTKKIPQKDILQMHN